MTTYLRFFDYDRAFNYYSNLISKMRQGYNSKNLSRIIAKPALILSIIKLIEDGKSVNSFSYVELDDTYKTIFRKVFYRSASREAYAFELSILLHENRQVLAPSMDKCRN